MPRHILYACLLVAACVLPFVLPSYLVFQATIVITYALALLGLNLLTGFNGQISLGHGAFFALGAYAAAMLMEHAGCPYWATPLAAALLGGSLGYLFGLPALKLDGVYLALATFALGVATPQLLKYKGFEPWTGTGVAGALAAVVVQFVAPDSFTVFLSITLLVGAVVGGLSSLSGALYGAAFIQFVPKFAEQVSKAAPWAVYGAILLALMLIWPTGVAGVVARLKTWFNSRSTT